MHAHGGVAEHCLGPRGRELDRAIGWLAGCVDDRIGERPERSVDLLLVDLVVGDGGSEEGIPIHQPLPAVDQPVAKHAKERPPDCPRADRVQREPRPPPIARGTDPGQLREDPLLVGVLPVPNAVDQLLAANVVPGQTLLFEHSPFDDRLRRDAGVVGAGHPQRFPPLLTPQSGQQVLERAVESVTEMQSTRDVRKRNDDRVRVAPGPRIGVEDAPLPPGLEPLRLHVGRGVLLGDLAHRSVSLVGIRGWLLGPAARRRLGHGGRRRRLQVGR